MGFDSRHRPLHASAAFPRLSPARPPRLFPRCPGVTGEAHDVQGIPAETHRAKQPRAPPRVPAVGGPPALGTAESPIRPQGRVPSKDLKAKGYVGGAACVAEDGQMVGIFSRLSGGRSGHRRTQSAIDVREPSQPNTRLVASASAGSVNSHGIEILSEFKPVEHPTEPLDHDQPVKCPLPEPSIINDGRIWKERMSANARVRAELPIVKESLDLESQTTGSRTRSGSAKRVMLPSISAPEHDLINLLEECNAA